MFSEPSFLEKSALLKEKLRPFLRKKQAIVIAYSGGLDSHVLLHLCATLKLEKVRAVHIHHGLNKEADNWVSHCQRICQNLSVPFTLIQVDALPEKGESREESARNARYEALKAELQKGDLLLTAQHREDQAETLLLQLFRGCGVKGLAAMPESAKFGAGWLLRPLLAVSQKSLQDYAAAHGLRWVEDSSNQDESFDRNYLRQSIIPLLEKRWPAISTRLARTSQHCGEAVSLLDGLADKVLEECFSESNETLLIDKVFELSRAQQRLVLRRWIENQNGRPPSTHLLNRIMQEVLSASSGTAPCVNWSGCEVRRYRNRLYFMRERKEIDFNGCYQWNCLTSTIRLPECGELSAEVGAGVGISVEMWNKGEIVVRFRQGGERLKPIGRNGSHQLKKLFQEAGIPPWERKGVPLVYIDNKLAAVSGLWVADWCKGKGMGDDIYLNFSDTH